ncbi:P-loop containing nucleoside triphosphate hydrolase [Artemisia annua]|uniref:Sulfotransferase n=1 Tax=Artemisia annua TaxID=35608 RepID=A0A2U1N0D3_ARTAN|nr:P-loop containing nucleoside triphosphate hydrolase [Artemisia annua]
MLPAIASNSMSITKEDEEKAAKTKISFLIEQYKDRVSTLPKHKSWINHNLYKYEGFWYHQGFWFHSNASFSIEVIMALQDEFQAQPSNVFLASHPKSGTTWLKALAFAIVNRAMLKNSTDSNTVHPLLTTSSHECVPFMETQSFLNNPYHANDLIATHLPYSLLPKSIISSNCRIVYICRNPKDVFISFWHFMDKLRDNLSPPIKLEDAFELFSRGVSPNGSCWDHVVGYRKASLERPDQVLFLFYEEMKKDPKNEVRKLAKFIGYPFSEEEDVDEEVEKIIELCSFEKLSKANKDAEETPKVIPNDVLFRKGEVGDSINYLTMEMVEILDKITLEKYDGLDISF